MRTIQDAASKSEILFPARLRRHYQDFFEPRMKPCTPKLEFLDVASRSIASHTYKPTPREKLPNLKNPERQTLSPQPQNPKPTTSQTNKTPNPQPTKPQTQNPQNPKPQTHKTPNPKPPTQKKPQTLNPNPQPNMASE